MDELHIPLLIVISGPTSGRSLIVIRDVGHTSNFKRKTLSRTNSARTVIYLQVALVYNNAS